MMVRLVLLFVFLASSAHAAISFDAQANGRVTGGTSVSFDLVVSGGCSNSFVASTTHWAANPFQDISASNIGGSAATHIATADITGQNRKTAMYRRLGLTGTQSISITWGGTSNAEVSALSYCGVDPTTPTGTPATAVGISGGSPVTVNVSSASGELVIDAAGVRSNSGTNTITVGSGQTQRYNGTDASINNLGNSEEAGAATVTMSWTINGDVDAYWGTVAVALKPAAPAAPDAPQAIVITE